MVSENFFHSLSWTFIALPPRGNICMPSLAQGLLFSLIYPLVAAVPTTSNNRKIPANVDRTSLTVSAFARLLL
jgi:hypothetical protein